MERERGESEVERKEEGKKLMIEREQREKGKSKTHKN